MIVTCSSPWRKRRIRRSARPGPASRICVATRLLLAVLIVGGCSRNEAPDDEAAFEIVKTYEQGPLRVDLRVERSKILVADRLRVVLEATAPESHEIELPGRSEKLGEFVVADSRAAQPRLVEDGRVLHHRSYVLEPFLAGEYKLPPLTVRCAQKQPRASGAQEMAAQEIATEEVTIEVASVLPQTGQQPQIKEIAEPVEMPSPWWPWVVSGVALVALAAALIGWRRRKQLDQEALAPPAPHEVAYRELEKLLAAGLLERGEAKLFYLRLSNVLRHYIEDRFGLRAPEQTTEEFLVELRQSQPLGPAHKELLQSFLEHCDLVKFAELEPTCGEAETTVTLCRRFVDETKYEESSTLDPVSTA